MGSCSGVVSVSEHSRGLVLVVASTIILQLGACAHGPTAPIEDRAKDRATLSLSSDPEPSIDDEITNDRLAPRVGSRSGLIRSTVAPERTATRQLLATSDVAMAAGNYVAAAASLDRAIRLTPNDALAWHKFAKLQFAQRDYAQAKATAQRSNVLPNATPALIAANWILIADIEQIIGDKPAARAAYAKARTQVKALDNRIGQDQDTGGNLPFSE